MPWRPSFRGDGVGVGDEFGGGPGRGARGGANQHRPRRGAAALMLSVRRARTDLPDKPINKRTLTNMFHALDVVAGVEPVEGRGWYGIRRKATDVYEDYESDERCLARGPHP